MTEKSSWPGLIPAARRFLMGQQAKPKVIGGDVVDSNRAGSSSYGGMDPNYKWFRVDRMVRSCVIINAYFSTMAAGFDTVLEATDSSLSDEAREASLNKHASLKAKVDEINKRVDMDQALFVAQVKRSIYGKAGFEVVPGQDKLPGWLLPLSSVKLKPRLNKDTWALEGYTYGNIRETKYLPDEVLYFTNLQLDADREGLSDIEPIRAICDARYEILHQNFPEIVRTLWAPYVLLKGDTSGMSDQEEDAFLENLAGAARSGKSIAFNSSVEATVVDVKADVAGLQAMLQDLKEEVIGNFGVPRFLLGQPIENRATAYAELEAYIDGRVDYLQRSLKRALEAQWYDPLTRQILEKDFGVKVPEDEEPDVVVKHQWRRTRTTDIYDMAQAVAALWSSGMGPFPDNREKLWELMGWPPDEFDDGRLEA